MNTSIIFFLPGILILGFITSYTDIKQGKIKNKAVLFSLVYTLLIYLSLLFILKTKINQQYIIQFLFNFIFALVVGFVMWDVGLWTAGDGKLFLGYSALVPIFIYNKASAVPYFSSLNILINTFVPLFIFFFFNLLIKTSWKQKKKALKNVFDLKKLLGLVASLFAFIWLYKLVFGLSRLGTNYFLGIFLFFILFTILEKFSIKLYFTIILLAVLSLFDPFTHTIQFWKIFVLWFLVFLITRFFILDLGFQTFTTAIKIKDLQEGMVPAEIVYEDKSKKELKKKKFLHFSFFEYLKEEKSKRIFDMSSEGLSKQDIFKLRQLKKKHPDLKVFRVQQTLPFAPFMFFGVILTLISNGNVFIFLTYLLVNFI